MNSSDVEDLLFYGVHGRRSWAAAWGYVLFYEPAYYLAHPLENPRGLAGRNGLSRRVARSVRGHCAVEPPDGASHFWRVTDFIAPLVPLGLMAGRIGNFINGELWGRVADATLPWAMVFPQVDPLPRHPSPLYQAAGEGLLLFLILWLYSARQRALGQISGMFMIGYGALRFAAEYFREPDHGIFGVSYVVSMGQWLSLPMVLFGLWLLLRKPLPRK
jgi:phosphatidylglycerol:prolipoprotein diacylglycerol transferase